MAPTHARFEVVGIGLAAIDDLVRVARFPAADSKVPVLGRVRRCGGLNATALVAAARLGAKTAYAGILGSDDDSDFVRDALEAKGVNTEHVGTYPGAGPVLSVIIVDVAAQTRTILADVSRVIGPDHGWLPLGPLREASVLMIDNYRIDLGIRAARVARGNGAAVVADFEGQLDPRLPELLALVDHLILARGFASLLSGAANPRSATLALRAPGRSVVVTCGSEGAWYAYGQRGRPVHQAAFPVDAVDTNGCGDVFHGAYAAGLVQGLDLPTRVRHAAAAAALSTMTPGGQEGIPDSDTVSRFLQERA